MAKSKPKKESVKKYNQSAIAIMEGSGSLGQKRQPFTYQSAIEQFNGWVYSACILNANACASIPLRLYSRKRAGNKAYDTRAVHRRKVAFLAGELGHKPSMGVIQKARRFDNYEEVADDHPILQLLNHVNPWFNGFDLQQLRFVYLQLTGNAYLYTLQDESGVPVELWPMPSQWMEVIPGTKNDDPFILGYAFGVNETQKTRFEYNEVIHFRWPNPNSLYYGMGKVEGGWNIINQNVASHAMDTAMYQNHARPDYAVIVKNCFQTDATKRFEKELESKFKGVKKSGKFVVFTGDVDIKPLAWPPKDLAGRDGILEEIASIFGVPITKMKANDPNRASAEVGDASWMRDTILPMLRMDEQKLNESLLPMFGIEGDAFLAYDNPIADDKVFERDTMIAYVGAGIKTLNEARGELGDELSAEPNADSLLVPSTLTPLAKLGERPEPTLTWPTPGVLSDAVDSGVTDEDDKEATITTDIHKEVIVAPVDAQGIQAAISIVADVGALRIPRKSGLAMLRTFYKMTDVEAEEIMADAGIVEVSQDVAIPETSPVVQLEYRPACSCKQDDLDPRMATYVLLMKDKLAIRLREIRQEVLQRIEEVGGEKAEKDVAGIVNRIGTDRIAKAFADVIKNDMLDAITAQLVMGAKDGLGKISMSENVWDVTNPRVREFVDDYTIRLARSISDHAVENIKEVVSKAVESGATVADMQTAIGKVPGWTDDGIANRAEMIARTESARAFVNGEIQAWKESGVVKGKQWLLSPDACEFCQAAAEEFGDNAGLDEVPIKFGSELETASGAVMKIDYMPVNGPPLHPFCRCDLTAIL